MLKRLSISILVLCAVGLAACGGGSPAASNSHHGSTTTTSAHHGSTTTTTSATGATTTTAAGGHHPTGTTATTHPVTTTTTGSAAIASCSTGTSAAQGLCEAKLACAQWTTLDHYIEEADSQDNAAIDTNLQAGAAVPDSTGPQSQANSGGPNAAYPVFLAAAAAANKDDAKWLELSDRASNLDSDMDSVDQSDTTTLDQVAGDSQTFGAYCKNQNLPVS